MEIGQLYQFVLLLVIVGMLIGAGIVALDKFSSTSGISAAAQTAINAVRDAISGIATSWVGLVVVIAMLAIIRLFPAPWNASISAGSVLFFIQSIAASSAAL